MINSNFFAVVDIEANWKNEMMSVGIVVAKKSDFSPVFKRYYLIKPACESDGMYSKSLLDSPETPILSDRETVIRQIRSILKNYHITSLFGYGASFDALHLKELVGVKWFDILDIAINRAYNRKITDPTTVNEKGNLIRGCGVEPIFRMLTDNADYHESHNGLRDALDELTIMRALEQPYEVFEKSPLRQKKKRNKKKKQSDKTKKPEEISL